MLQPALRTLAIDPFRVMEFIKHADALAAQGRSILHLSIGEPDFTAPEIVQDAAAHAIRAGTTGYTPALGLPALRVAIADHYRDHLGVAIDPARIVVTAGASAALLLAVAALVERDAEVLMADPSYPCNRHFVSAFEGRPSLVPTGPETAFQLSASLAAAHWTTGTRGVVVASPSNPTGTSLVPAEMDALLQAVAARGGFAIVDEIYQGLTYGPLPAGDRAGDVAAGAAPPRRTALALHDDAVVINSFSKYFSMTGWRLGWLVAPPALLPTLEKLAQNLYICPSAIAQHAALACFTPTALAEYERRRAAFERRRNLLVPALRALGIGVPVAPDGAFYVWCDVGRFTDDSARFARDLLEATGVCVVPGLDFGRNATHRHVRVSYATDEDRIAEALVRMSRFLDAAAARVPPAEPAGMG